MAEADDKSDIGVSAKLARDDEEQRGKKKHKRGKKKGLPKGFGRGRKRG